MNNDYCIENDLPRQQEMAAQQNDELVQLRAENERNAEQVHELASENDELREQLERVTELIRNLDMLWAVEWYTPEEAEAILIEMQEKLGDRIRTYAK